MNKRHLSGLQSWLAIVLAGLLLLWTLPSRAAVELPNGIYHETVDDLTVKVMGGYVKAQRTWYAGKWYHTRAWNNLQIEYNALDGSVSRLGRNYDIYSSSSTGGFRYDLNDSKRLDQTDSGYRWSDKKGNWIDYDSNGKIIKYGDRNNIEVSFIYDSQGNRTGVKDHFGNQVLWYTYNASGQVTSVRDHADPAQARTVTYEYTDGLLTKVTDVLGNAWHYSYTSTRTDTSGGNSLGTGGTSAYGIDGSRTSYTLLLTTKTDPLGRTTNIEYNANKKVSRVVMPNGNERTYNYDYDKTKKEYYTRVTQPTGRIDETWFNKDGDVIRRDVNGTTIETILISGNTYTHTDERGNQFVRYHDSRDNLLREVYPDGSEKSWQYDTKYSNVLKKTDERGVITRYEYNDHGNLLRMTEAEGKPAERVTTYTYDEYGNQLTETKVGDARTEEAVTTQTFDDKGNVITRIDAENQEHQYNYTIFGKVDEYTDPRGGIWRYNYDDVGQLLSSENPLGHITRFEYDKVGKLVKRISPAPQNYETTYSYDSADRLTGITDALGGVTEYRHDEAGRIKAVIDASGRAQIKHIGYNTRDNIAQVIDGADNVASFGYGPGTDGELYGQLNVVNYPTYITRYQYDPRGRTIAFTDEFGNNSRTSQQIYDPAGNLITEIDAVDRSTDYEYDALGRLTSEQNPTGGITSFVYDDRDNLVSVTNAKGIVIRRYEYDRINRMTREVRSDGGDYRYTYDTINTTVTRTDALGQQTRYRYDAVGRMYRIDYYATGSTSVVRSTQFSYDAQDRLIGYNDGTTSAVYEYDSLGRKISETIDYGPFRLSYSYSYDAAGRKTTFTAPDGATTNYTYDVGGRLETITPAGSGTLTLGGYQWTEATRLGLPGGGSQVRSYDGLMRQTGITGLDPANNPILDYQYDRDAVNNILARTTEYGEYIYEYDNLDRLITADNPTLPDEQYSYDPVGNRLSSADTTGTWQYSDADELLAYNDTQLEYDANGSLIKKTVGGTVTRYEYTLDNRLKRFYRDDGSLDAHYGYDPFGRRLWKEVDGQRRYFLYADEGLIAEADATGTLIRQYGWQPDGLWGTDPLYLKQGGQTYYYHNDHLGTPQKLVSVTGQLVWEARYTAFGKAQTAGTVENPLRLPGQYYDAETGMHYNTFRYYAPEIGRYITSDPIDIAGGINTYSYVSSNPIKFMDYFGLEQGTEDDGDWAGCNIDDRDTPYDRCVRDIKRNHPIIDEFIKATSIGSFFRKDDFPSAAAGYGAQKLYSEAVRGRERQVVRESLRPGPRGPITMEGPNRAYQRSATLQKVLRGAGKLLGFATIIGTYADVWISVYCLSKVNLTF